MFDYLVKEDEFLPVQEIDESGLSVLSSDVRRKILKQATDGGVTTEDLIEELSLDQQTSYYHLQKLEDAGFLQVEGSRPKKFTSTKTAYYFRPEFVESEKNPLMLQTVPDILKGFVEDRKINARVIVGAPYPHGEHDRRHKSAYKVGEITAILGNYGRRRQQLIHTDTELDEKIRENPLISVAGPLVNTLTEELNSEMPAKFTESHDRIITENGTYSGDETGFIAKTEVDGKPRLVVAGLFGLGTSAAIEAISSRAGELGEKGAIVKGYGTKHNIEEVEIVEKL